MRKLNRLLTLEWASTVRIRLLIAFLALGMLPAVALGYYGYRSSAQALTEAVGERLEASAGAQGELIDRNYFERYGDVAAFSKNPLATRGRRERQEIVNFLTTNYEIYDLVLIVGRDGKVMTANTVDSTGQPIESEVLFGTDVSDTAWFQEAFSGSVPPGESVFGAAHQSSLVDAVYEDGRTTLPFTSPIYNSLGHVVGVWHNEASLSRVAGRASQMAVAEFVENGFTSAQAHIFTEDGEALLVRGSRGATNGTSEQFSQRIWETIRSQDNPYSGHTVIKDPQSGEQIIVGYAKSDGAFGFPGYGWTVAIQKDAAEAARPALALRNSVLVAAVIVAVLLATAAIMLARAIASPLRGNAELLDRVADGDLSVSFATASNDEVGKMGNALNQALESIGSTLAEVDKGTGELGVAATELTQVSSVMAKGANETFDQASEVASAAEQIAASSHSVALAMDEMSGSIHEISVSTSSAAALTSQAVTVSDQTKMRMEQLDASATDIGAVVNVINSIAAQTDLLALNATIEAARVGEAGKGFAVVANEVKALARQTADATGEIRAKIDAIQGDAKQAVQAIAEIADLIDRVNEASTVIAGAVEEQSATSAEVSASIMAMTDGTSNISSNIVAVADAARSTKSGAQESADSAQELAQLATRLQTMLSRFKLNGVRSSSVAHLTIETADPNRSITYNTSVDSAPTWGATPVTKPDSRLLAVSTGSGLRGTGAARDSVSFDDLPMSLEEALGGLDDLEGPLGFATTVDRDGWEALDHGGTGS